MPPEARASPPGPTTPSAALLGSPSSGAHGLMPRVCSPQLLTPVAAWIHCCDLRPVFGIISHSQPGRALAAALPHHGAQLWQPLQPAARSRLGSGSAGRAPHPAVPGPHRRSRAHSSYLSQEGCGGGSLDLVRAALYAHECLHHEGQPGACKLGHSSGKGGHTVQALPPWAASGPPRASHRHPGSLLPPEPLGHGPHHPATTPVCPVSQSPAGSIEDHCPGNLLGMSSGSPGWPLRSMYLLLWLPSGLAPSHVTLVGLICAFLQIPGPLDVSRTGLGLKHVGGARGPLTWPAG